MSLTEQKKKATVFTNQSFSMPGVSCKTRSQLFKREDSHSNHNPHLRLHTTCLVEQTHCLVRIATRYTYRLHIGVSPMAPPISHSQAGNNLSDQCCIAVFEGFRICFLKKTMGSYCTITAYTSFHLRSNLTSLHSIL